MAEAAFAAAGRREGSALDQLCALDGARHDPCVLDTFSAVVAFANGEPAQPWWIFSRRRKEREQAASIGS